MLGGSGERAGQESDSRLGGDGTTKKYFYTSIVFDASVATDWEAVALVFLILI